MRFTGILIKLNGGVHKNWQFKMYSSSPLTASFYSSPCSSVFSRKSINQPTSLLFSSWSSFTEPVWDESNIYFWSASIVNVMNLSFSALLKNWNNYAVFWAVKNVRIKFIDLVSKT